MLVVLGLMGPAAAWAGSERVSVPSLDRVAGAPVVLVGYWFAAGTGRGPAVVMLHGCGGPYTRQGELGEREIRYAGLLNERDVHMLVLDSFSARGEAELCTQKIGTRRVTQLNRRRDALGALQWLAQRAEVDASRIGLLGFSNGGSTVLAATNLAHAEVAANPVRAAFAVAFYPGCEEEAKRGYRGSGELLVLVGEADDWTPAAPCKELAATSPRVAIEAYPGAHHGFDSMRPVRLRANVPNGVNPGKGVHVGGDPGAREASQRRLMAFIDLQRLAR